MTLASARNFAHFTRLLGLAVLACGLVAVSPGAARAESDAEGFDALAEASEPLPPPSDDRVIGRVSGVHGKVYAESPDGARRLLVDDAPIYPGDRLVTARGAQLGVLSGDHYTGLNEDTELSFALTPGGAPEVRMVRGHVRVLESGEEAAAARLETPALEVASAGGDVEVYAFPEKAHIVSMVCALEGQVQAAGVAGGSATVGEGGCAVAKPGEPIYAAGAAGAPLGVLPPVAAGAAAGAAGPAAAGGAGAPAAASAAGAPPVGAAGPMAAGAAPMSLAGPAASRFDGPPPVSAALAFNDAPKFDYDRTFWTSCDNPAGAAACGVNSIGGGPNPPTNPPVPGPLPPFPTNPPTNPPVPGPLPPFPTP